MRHKESYYSPASWLLISAVMIFLSCPVSRADGTASGNNLEISSSGFMKTWCGISDPLGKTVDLKTFNNQSSSDTSDIGIFWWSPRDIGRIELAYDQSKAITVPLVQYWQETWPETPPAMPSKEDLEDDPWQGKWLTASVDTKSSGNKAIITFTALSASENRNAKYLPAPVSYRRTLKIRLVYPGQHPSITSLKVYSVSKEKESSVRVEFIKSEKNKAQLEGSAEIFNGKINKVSPWHWDGSDKKTGTTSFRLKPGDKPKGIIIGLTASTESLPGSNDETVLTLKTSEGNYSVSMNDIDKGPVYIPAYNVYLTLASDPVSFSASVIKGKRIRERIPEEPEQSYDRAKKEIPALDPTSRVGGGNIDLPLAADASWQKFSVQWGGNILLEKNETKAQGRELERCNWTDSDLRWNIGTGSTPQYQRTLSNCQMSVLDDYLPVVQAYWTDKGFTYREEAFATLLKGPLSPVDPGRDEQTPAVLMVKITVANPTNHTDTSHVWLTGNKALNGLTRDGNFLMDRVNGQDYIRCFIPELGGVKEKIDLVADNQGIARIIHRQIPVEANSSRTFYLCFPFVGDMTASDKGSVESLDFDSQKDKVVAYWRKIVTDYSVYNVPERKFNEMAKAVIPHIRISVTKDPKSGLYMVPAAALSYWVYPNEAVFQTLLLDRLGDFKTSQDYLNTFLKLQGSAKLPGSFTGNQEDVFFGTKVDVNYDYTESNGYNMHHGTTLWGLARHFLYSRDTAWLLKAKPNMVRAAKWIIDQRSQTKILDEKGNKVTHYGLLPAGVLEDVHDWQFWFATNAYACMGLESMAKAFAKAGFPEAEYFKQEAEAYHNDIRRSIEVSSELCPVVRLRNNTYVPYVPTQPYQRFRYFGSKKAEYYDRYNLHVYPTLRLSSTREVLYGPVVLLKAGLVDPEEKMAGWILDDWEDNLTISSSMNINVHGRVEDEYWFSKGGMVFQANLQNPVSIYLQRKEIPATIRGMYDNFISCLYPDVNAHTEEYREWGHGSGPFYKCPDEARFISQVCDILVVERNGELWLAPGTPRRWLEAGQIIEVNKAQTEFGEVSYTMKPLKHTEGIETEIQLPPFTCSKLRLFVRAPFGKPIRSVLINGKAWNDWDPSSESVVIPQTGKTARVQVYF